MRLLLLLAATAAAAPPPALDGWWHRRADTVLYAEALCPYCAAWLAKAALPFVHDLGGVAQLHAVFWGNARAAPDGEVTCQHGPEECELNRLYNCVVHGAPRSAWVPFLACASAHHPKVAAAVDKCAARTGVNATAARACAASRRGADLTEAARKQTEGLVPAHAGVPWFTVERLPVGGDSGALGVVACAAWRGPRPAACYRAPPDQGGAASV
jgi:interferon gamma-inducible protein 30